MPKIVDHSGVSGEIGFGRLALVLWLAAAFAEPVTGQGELLQGNAKTEAEAAEGLLRLAATLDSPEAWRARSERVRRGVLEGASLTRLPDPCPLAPVRHGLKQMEGYTVENVALQCLPGFYVSGNLYLPSPRPEGLTPGVLCPHGHGNDPRFSAAVQTRSASLARMGAAVFAWDMVGHGESAPCPHGFDQVLRLQTYSGMRAVDFLLSLGSVDGERLAVTGASGGGTQSFLLAAVDPRIDVSVPVVQVSAHFYGGCPCESGMPIHKSADHETSNAEIAALCAPRPMLVVSDGADWTSNTPDVEFPFIQGVYRLLGAEGNVENAHFAEERHNYGPSKRAAMYRFLARHLGLDLAAVCGPDGRVTEPGVRVLEADSLRVFDATHPRPAGPEDCDAVVRLLDRTG